jgi:enoyl-[acyl-carrier protein] reductase I
MGLFTGKKGIVMGVANEFSIASGIAKVLAAEGATLGFNHLPDKEGRDRMAKRAAKVADPLGVKFVRPCDVTSEDDVKAFFGEVKAHFGHIDFFVHSIAYAPLEDIRCATIDASREGFKVAMDISVYSFIATAREAAKLMPDGGSIATMSYFGGERVVGGYNLMGVCKAALEQATRYLAFDLGPKRVRVNAVSAGPIKTLAASAVGDFSQMLGLYAAVSPMGRNVTQEEVGKATAFLLSDLSSATTGEIMHVDGGYNIMGSPGHAVERMGLGGGRASDDG